MSKAEPTPASGAESAWQEFWNAQLASHLAALFGSADPAALAELQADAEWVSLRGGDVLFRRGDPGNAAYTVLSGRLRVVDDTVGERALNEIGAGEILGEMALLSAERRSATVFAVRDSLLARLPAAAFHRLIERQPAVLRRISALLSERLRTQSAAAGRARAVVRTLAVVPAAADPDAAEFARRLVAALALRGATLHLDAERVDRALGREGIARCAEHDPASPRLVQWLNEQELAHRFVLYEADPRLSGWTERAVRQADHVVFVANAAAAPEPGEVERSLAARWRGARAPRRGLVLLRAAGASAPERHGRLPRGAGGRLPLPRQHATGRRTSPASRAASPGLASAWCSGAAGRAASRIWACCGRSPRRTFRSTGWAGPASARSSPRSWRSGAPRTTALAQCKEHFSSLRDPTLPVVALLAGRRIRAKLEHVFGTAAIEDLAASLPVRLDQSLARGAERARAGTAGARDPREHRAAGRPAAGEPGRATCTSTAGS